MKEDKSPNADTCASHPALHRARWLRACHRRQTGRPAADRPCAKISTCRPAVCASRARSATCAFPPGQISFDVYKGSQFEARRPPSNRRARHDQAMSSWFRKAPITSFRITVTPIRLCAPTFARTGRQADRYHRYRTALLPSRSSWWAIGAARRLPTPRGRCSRRGGDVIRRSIGAFPARNSCRGRISRDRP